MSWQDRIRQAAYTGPDGIRHVFGFDDVAREASKKTSAYAAPDAPGVSVQDRGESSRRLPLTVYFNGDDHDTQADAFFESLLVPGQGILEHPRYGRANVVPFGDIRQRDRLVTEAAQTSVEVTFWVVRSGNYPTDQTDSPSEIGAAIQAATDASADKAAAIAPTTPSDVVSYAGQFEALRETVARVIEPMTRTNAAAWSRFRQINDAINDATEIVLGDPLTQAYQVAALVQLPAMLAITAREKINGYTDIMNAIVAIISPTAPDFAARSVWVDATMSAATTAVLAGGYDNKPEAIAAVDSLLAMFDAWTEWRDLSRKQTEQGDTFQNMQNAVVRCAGYTVTASFTLRTERRVILDQDAALVPLCAELTGSVSNESIEAFVNDNRLTGREILEIPKGREIVYYV